MDKAGKGRTRGRPRRDESIQREVSATGLQSHESRDEVNPAHPTDSTTRSPDKVTTRSPDGVVRLSEVTTRSPNDDTPRSNDEANLATSKSTDEITMRSPNEDTTRQTDATTTRSPDEVTTRSPDEAIRFAYDKAVGPSHNDRAQRRQGEHYMDNSRMSTVPRFHEDTDHEVPMNPNTCDQRRYVHTCSSTCQTDGTRYQQRRDSCTEARGSRVCNERSPDVYTRRPDAGGSSSRCYDQGRVINIDSGDATHTRKVGVARYGAAVNHTEKTSRHHNRKPTHRRRSVQAQQH